MAVLDIVKFPDPRLRESTFRVGEITDGIRDLVRDLISAGLVGDVTVADEAVRVRIDLISPGYPLKSAVEASVRDALSGLDRPLFVDFGLKVPRKVARQDLNRLPPLNGTQQRRPNWTG